MRGLARRAVAAAGLCAAAACSSPADQQLEAVKSARSITAEWAHVEQLRTDGKVTGTYAAQMAAKAREQLAAERKQMADAQRPEARTIDAVLAGPADSAALGDAARALAAVEKQREHG